MKKCVKYLSVIIATLILLTNVLFVVQTASAGTTINGVKQVAAGVSTTYVISKDGSLWGWGENQESELAGKTSKTYSLTPLKIMDGVSYVVSKSHSTFAIKTDGSLWGWGNNVNKQISYTGDKIIKKPVKVLDKVKAVEIGQGFTMCIKSDGTLWGWGLNDYGQIGTSANSKTVKVSQYETYTYTTKPTKIMSSVKAVAAGAFHCMAIKQDGSLWAWGDNSYGQIGNGGAYDKNIKISSYATRYSPVIITPRQIIDDVKQIYADAWGSFCIKNDNTLWSWGSVTATNGASKKRSFPVMDLEDVIAFTGTSTTSLVIKKNGSLWGWGLNSYGELAKSNESYNSSIYKIMDNVNAVSLHGWTCICLKKDGTVWAWGRNDFGEIGNGKKGPKTIMGDFDGEPFIDGYYNDKPTKLSFIAPKK